MLRRSWARLSTKAKNIGGYAKPSESQQEQDPSRQLEVAFYPHRALLTPSEPVTEKEINAPTFVSKIFELNRIATDRSMFSISAPKHYWHQQIILVKSGSDRAEYECWINPEIPNYDDKNSVSPMYGMWEGCASCGQAIAWVIRPQSIHVSGLDQYGAAKKELLTGLRARCVMHEMDHLKGTSMFNHTPSPDYVTTIASLLQKDIWPPNFPSAEAYETPIGYFWDYVSNQVVVPQGLDWLILGQQEQQQFKDAKIEPPRPF